MKYTGEILDSGIGAKDRRAALVGAMTDAVRKAHGNSETGKALAAILTDAEQRLADRRTRKAEKAAAGDEKPAKPAKKAKKVKKAAAEPQPQPSAAPSREERAAAMKAAGDAWRAKRGKAD